MRKLKGARQGQNDRIDAWLIAETLRIGQYDETRLATDGGVAGSLSRYLQSLRGMAAELKTVRVPDGRALPDGYSPDMFGAGSRRGAVKSPLPFRLARGAPLARPRHRRRASGAAESRSATPKGIKAAPGRRSA